MKNLGFCSKMTNAAALHGGGLGGYISDVCFILLLAIITFLLLLLEDFVHRYTHKTVSTWTTSLLQARISEGGCEGSPVSVILDVRSWFGEGSALKGEDSERGIHERLAHSEPLLVW